MEKNFEASLGALEKIVRDLEAGDLPLEESLKLFEKGVKLSRECQERLDQAERRIEVLTRDADGKPLVEPLAVAAENREVVEAAPKSKKRYVFETDDEVEDSVF